MSTATILTLRMRARPTDIMGRAGLPAESLSARARGITDGAGRSIRASATIMARSATDSLAAAMKDAVSRDADLQDVVQARASTVDRYAVARFTAAVSAAVAAAGSTVAAEAGSMVAADAGKGSLN